MQFAGILFFFRGPDCWDHWLRWGAVTYSAEEVLCKWMESSLSLCTGFRSIQKDESHECSTLRLRHRLTQPDSISAVSISAEGASNSRSRKKGFLNPLLYNSLWDCALSKVLKDEPNCNRVPSCQVSVFQDHQGKSYCWESGCICMWLLLMLVQCIDHYYFTRWYFLLGYW